MDNPFAVQSRRRPPLRALKTLLVVVVGLVCVLGFQWGSQRWLLASLEQDLDQQPPEQQIERLAQIAQLGSNGLPVLVEYLQTPNERVAETAFELLKQQQQQWLELSDAAADANHRRLAAALTELGPELELRRGGWVAMLLKQTIVETVEHPSSDAAVAYDTATTLLAKISVSDNLNESTRPVSSTTRVALRTEPLPVAQTSATVQPLQPTTQDTGEASSNAQTPANSSNAPPQSNPLNSNGAASAPANAATLQPLTDQQTVPLQSPGVTRIRENASNHHVVVPVEHLSAEPFEAYTTRSVIAWLRSVQPELRDSAHHELRRRGFDDQQLALASRLADPDVRVRLGLLNELSRQTEIEPRQWLMWLGEDAEPDVRRRAIAAIGTMDDPAITQWLREHLAGERDPAVADLVRRILSQR
ncbi:HEAT repeat domain-containing protein [Roseimaritima ulvae]|uniref:HEAT repeat protein n=1 Tax=Roseimaritima ulvae TaxID=980254 RepID=A0A5B9QQA1_9BACT|nr:HEAT repeat domain-containing protein [Roseimaritima ulvae]QEG41154.1 hypothetical protein UC8_31730 [Roseimaritima ulvae]